MASISVRSPRVHSTDIQIGARIKQRRVNLEMTQITLGKAVGVTFQQVQKYEKGMNRVGGSRLAMIAEVLNCPVSFFFEGVENRSTDRTMQENIPQLNRASIRLLQAYQKLPARLQVKVGELVAAMANVTTDIDGAA